MDDLKRVIKCMNCAEADVELIGSIGKCSLCKASHTIQLRVPLGTRGHTTDDFARAAREAGKHNPQAAAEIRMALRAGDLERAYRFAEQYL